MKQGTGRTTVSGTKTEPRSYGINPAAVADFGIQTVRTRTQRVYEGRGLQAPMAGCTTHKCGSQGRH
jgi:hypothetical protein